MHPGAVSTKSAVCQEVLFPLESIMLMPFFFFPFCMLFFFFPEEQLSGFIFIEAKEENCSFAAELLFVISRSSPSDIAASPSPSHSLLGGAYTHADAASFLPPPPFPGLIST